ncbi:MAG: zinc-dependent alcohol dehydrogenase family protein, partial [Blastocatellia bacterium]
DQLGGAEVLKIEEVPVADPGADEVRIKIEAMSLNRADALFRRGTYLYQPKLPGSRIGTDAAGVVEAVGANVKDLKIGDRVLTFPGFDVSTYGTHAETAVVPARFAAKYPDHLSAVEATSIAVQYLTAWDGLCDHGAMAAGDFVLITAASSSVGVAAIQLARAAGAIPVATTRTAAKKQGLFDAGAAEVIITGEENLVERARQITGGKGARLIFDPVAGAQIEQLADAVSQNGTIFIYGTLSSQPTPLPLRGLLMKEASVRGVVVYNVYADPDRFARGLQHIYDGFKSGALKLLVDRTFPFGQYADAHRHLESNEQLGRIVITV